MLCTGSTALLEWHYDACVHYCVQWLSRSPALHGQLAGPVHAVSVSGMLAAYLRGCWGDSFGSASSMSVCNVAHVDLVSKQT